MRPAYLAKIELPQQKESHNKIHQQGSIAALFSSSKKSSKCWAFSDRYGRMDKGDERCWNAGKWIEIW